VYVQDLQNANQKKCISVHVFHLKEKNPRSYIA